MTFEKYCIFLAKDAKNAQYSPQCSPSATTAAEKSNAPTTVTTVTKTTPTPATAGAPTAANTTTKPSAVPVKVELLQKLILVVICNITQ